jgi:pentatricopeptide repeat protein
MVKNMILKNIKITAYTLSLGAILYVAFFYQPSGFAGGRAKGGAIAILAVLAVVIVGGMMYTYKKTKDINKVWQMLNEMMILTISPSSHVSMKSKRKK